MNHPFDKSTIRATIAQWMREELASNEELVGWLKSLDGKEALESMFSTTLGRIYNSAHAQYLASAVMAVRRSTRTIVGHTLQGHPEVSAELKRLEGIIEASDLRAPTAERTAEVSDTR